MFENVLVDELMSYIHKVPRTNEQENTRGGSSLIHIYIVFVR